MTIRMFKDAGDGEYQVEIPNGSPPPDWIKGMTECVVPAKSLSKAQQEQAALILATAQAAIVGGFSSSALGTATSYPGTLIDQQNINAVALVGGSLWCADSAGKWSFVAHTKAQAAQVQADMVAWIQAQQTKNATKQAAIASAATVSAVLAIVW